jgi:hypothetical protein
LVFILYANNVCIVVVKWCVKYKFILLLCNNMDSRDATRKNPTVALVFVPIDRKTVNTQTLRAIRVPKY